jgi:SAM-dependent methyltransferase
MNISTEPVSWKWTWELLKGFTRIKHRLFPKRATKDPLEYFSRLPARTYEEYHVASEDDVIRYFLITSPSLAKKVSQKHLKVYDLGCGYGDLFFTIPFDSSSSITLVDFARVPLESAFNRLSDTYKNVETICTDLRSRQLPPDSADIAFAINILPYFDDNAVKNLLNPDFLRNDGLLCLVYPTRSFVWEEFFEGIRIRFFDSRLIADEAASVGLHLVEDSNIFFRLPIFRRKIVIGRLQVFKKIGN